MTGSHARRMMGWLGLAGADAVGRLLMQIAATAVLARMLGAEAFGAAAIVFSTVALAATIAGGVPFEEALVHRRGVKRGHFQSALAASLVAALGVVALVLLFGDALGGVFGIDDGRLLLLGGCALLFANAFSVVLIAFARRRRRFAAVAQASLASNAFGCVAAVAIAVLGGGVWALIALRVLQVFANAALLAIMLGVFFMPAWRPERFREIAGFASISLGERFVENANYLVFNYAVGALFGLGALGQLNMAMRIVEPLRGAFLGISHNLAYPGLMRAARSGRPMSDAVAEATMAATLLAAPVFLGLAAVSPTLIPLLAGPGWEDAVLIAIMLAAGGSITTTVQMLYTSSQVLGRPDLNLKRRLVGLASLAAVLAAAQPFGAAAAGVARVGGDAAEALWSATASRRLAGQNWAELFQAMGPPWLAAAAMAVIVGWLGGGIAPRDASFVDLIGLVAAGGALYVGLIVVFSRRHFRAALGWGQALKGASA